ncbi:MAG: arsenosugar biosynthesis radical SAM (seleno)protein ArsS [Verrucomicrobiota bacterium]
MNRFDKTLLQADVPLQRSAPEILQINLGKLCNLTCVHCHVNAGPKRREIITRETLEKILNWLRQPTQQKIGTLDLTGGTPEMIPNFQWFIRELRTIPHVHTIMDRLNATILQEPGFEWVAPFHAEHQLTLVASMPCYSPDNVNAQRGDGVFESSISAFQKLNTFGYGSEPELQLHFVYNPNGAFLPGDQAELKADYQREMKQHFGIVFNDLYTITNMPIARYASYLRRNKKLAEYMDLLIENFNPSSINGLMCRNTISVGWEGEIYDCDFNQQLGLGVDNAAGPIYLWDLDLSDWTDRAIQTGDHCFGCTAGAGSSCTGALV